MRATEVLALAADKAGCDEVLDEPLRAGMVGVFRDMIVRLQPYERRVHTEARFSGMPTVPDWAGAVHRLAVGYLADDMPKQTVEVVDLASRRTP